MLTSVRYNPSISLFLCLFLFSIDYCLTPYWENFSFVRVFYKNISPVRWWPARYRTIQTLKTLVSDWYCIIGLKLCFTPFLIWRQTSFMLNGYMSNYFPVNFCMIFHSQFLYLEPWAWSFVSIFANFLCEHFLRELFIPLNFVWQHIFKRGGVSK